MPLSEVEILIKQNKIELDEEIGDFNKSRLGASGHAYTYEDKIIVIPLWSHQAYVFKSKTEYMEGTDKAVRESSKMSNLFEMIVSEDSLRASAASCLQELAGVLGFTVGYQFDFSDAELAIVNDRMAKYHDRLHWGGITGRRQVITYGLLWLEHNLNCPISLKFDYRNGTFIPAALEMSNNEKFDWFTYVFTSFTERDDMLLEEALRYMKRVGCSKG